MGSGAGGAFIAFEGVEGAGKTTQVRLLAEWLEERKIPHVVTREPGGTETGEELRRLLLAGGAIAPRTELLLMLAARSALVEERIRPALDAGCVVVVDRFEMSTLAYQGYGRGLPLEEVRRLNAFATGGLSPDVTVMLDVPLDVGTSRRTDAGRVDDRIEREGDAFHRRVVEAYGLLARELPRVEVVDGRGPPDRVLAEVLRSLRKYFRETLRPPAGY